MVVTFAVMLLTLNFTMRFFLFFSDAPRFDTVIDYLALAPIVAIPYLFIWFIFRGKNWARRVFLVMFGLALVSGASRTQDILALPTEEVAALCMQMILMTAVAIALSSATAADWFKGNRTILNQEAKAAAFPTSTEGT